MWRVISSGRPVNYGFIAIPIIAILYTIYVAREPAYRMRAITLLLILVSAYAMMLYQIRGLAFLLQLSVIPLAAMMGQVYRRYKDTKAPLAGLLFLVLLFASIPNTWMVGIQFYYTPYQELNNEVRSGDFKECHGPGQFDTLASLPTGVVVASPNLGVMILLNSQHRALVANFHRGQDGILAGINLKRADMANVREMLARWNVDYVVLCDNDLPTKQIAENYPDGLWAKLYNQEVPDFLFPVPGNDESLIYIYKTQP